jgi:hypothetical protein
MEVFLGYTKDDDFTLLKQTLEAWDMSGVELAAIQCSPKKFEIALRVAADNMAKGEFYILADLGCVPAFSVPWEELAELIAPDCGLVGLAQARVPQPAKFPTGVRICRKGAVEKWVPKRSDTYDEEHVESLRLVGKRTEIWCDVFYQKLTATSN